MVENSVAQPWRFRVATRLRLFLRGPADLDSLCAYIDGQEEHHRQRTFQDEFRMFLAKYKVEYNEAYVWD